MKTGSAKSLVALILWHLAGLVAIVGILSQLLIGRSITSMRSQHFVFLFALAAAFMLSSAVNMWWQQRRLESSSVARTILLVVASFGMAALALVLVQATYIPRSTFVACIALSMILLTLTRWMRTGWLLAGAAVLLAVSIGVQAFMGRIVEVRPAPVRSASVINTKYLSLRATYYENYFPNCDPQTGGCDFIPRIGGGISGLGRGYLLATGEGFLYYFTRDARGALTVSRLPYTVPLNDGRFATSVDPQSDRERSRATDILVEERGEQAILYAAHHYYNERADCMVLRLSVMRGSAAGMASGTMPQKWNTVYETKPCMPRGRQAPLAAESGGRLARLDPSTLLMSVGDHNFNGVDFDMIASQDLESDYGKTLAIDVDRGVASVFTFGHRNPQGLYVTTAGEIWSVEHGPDGGDELNRLVRGTNYGWPLVTYGTNYGSRTWPISKTPYDHRGFQEPVYSWVPSIAVSNLIMLEKDRFASWRGDLLIGSYLQSLLRARIREGRLVTLEPVRLRERWARIRDLFEDRDGNIVIWFDGGTVAFLEPAESVPPPVQPATLRGETLFAACVGCHALADGATHRIGPDLAGIVNHPIAKSEGFSYSAALAEHSGRWTEENLDRFLADPQAFAPGNTMQFSGLPNPADRAELIAYLKGTRSQARQ